MPVTLTDYLNDCRSLVTSEIRRIIPGDSRYQSILYDLMLDYPLRECKALRPALCISTCRALGGNLESVLCSAAVLELYHNAFLIHDDVEDQSLMRRGSPTLHQAHGVPIAINVGDAMLALTLKPLLKNIGIMGLGPALQVLDAISTMVQESVHGQAVELDWVRCSKWDVSLDDYVNMVILKTGWYSFITPVTIGAIAARAAPDQLEELTAFARQLSVAFQIQDDILNLSGDVTAYGKEIGGDLWEGKRTVILIRLIQSASPNERREIRRILELQRPFDGLEESDQSELLLEQLVAEKHLTAEGKVRLETLLERPRGHFKSIEDVEYLMRLIKKYECIDFARQLAQRWTHEAQLCLDKCGGWLLRSIHRSFLEELVAYVYSRLR
jgi:geranylgeranyl diphosphate synthase type II